MNLQILLYQVWSFKPNMDIEILKTTRDKPKLCMNGYIYNHHRTLTNNREYWRCERLSTKCKGTVTTSTNYDNPKVEQNHNHDRCQDEVDALRARNHIKAESVKPRRLFHVVTFWSGDSRVLYLYGALCSEYRTEMNSLNSVTSDLADCTVNMCVWCMCC